MALNGAVPLFLSRAVSLFRLDDDEDDHGRGGGVATSNVKQHRAVRGGVEGDEAARATDAKTRRRNL